MKEKEQEAIDTLAIRVSTSKARCEDYPNCICMKKDLTLVLNLIQKQQKEIEKLRNNNKDLLRKLRNRIKEVKKLTKYSLYKKEFSRLNVTIEKKNNDIQRMQELLDLSDANNVKKDKIINEMIIEIYQRTHTKEGCSFYNIEEICRKYSSCTECIFKYFERIVENEIK